METPVTVLILAAGLGTRMKSRKAKVLHQVGGRTIIEHIVKTALTVTEADRITVILGHQASEVREAVAGHGIHFVVQSEQRGTGDAVMAAADLLRDRDGLVVVLYGDAPLLSDGTLRRLVRTQDGSTAAATVITTHLDDPTGYGRAIVDEEGRLRAIVEEKAASPEQKKISEVNSGIYCFRADLLWKHLPEISTDNPAGEYYLTDIVELFQRAGHWVGAYHLEDPVEVLGINTRVELAEVDRIFRVRKARDLMLSGVTIEKPETVSIDLDVRIGTDTIVEPFSQILGRTVIGSGCRIGSSAIVRNSRIGDGVEIGPFTIVNDSEVDDGARVGPYARLRFDNHVEAGAAVGNFVELKKARLGPDAKALHLSYLGDTTIASGVNVGAGTITCNFDGMTKHQTTIRSGAFIGSNATLVAPVEIGEDSYVGAGSVITKPVPKDSLALGRSRQIVKEGWAKKRREKDKAK